MKALPFGAMVGAAVLLLATPFAFASDPVDVLGELRRDTGAGTPAWASDAEFRGAVDRLHSEARRHAPPPSFPPDPRGWATPGRARPDASEEHRRFPHPPGPHPAKPEPRTTLLHQAFELERIAHELDVAEQYAAADAVRSAAIRVRATARRTSEMPTGDPRDAERRERRRSRQQRGGERRPGRPAPQPRGVFGGPHEAEASDRD